MNFTGCIECGSLVIENEALHLCASCAGEQRKQDRQAKKNALKRPAKIAKMSEKKAGKILPYAILRRKFLDENPVCEMFLPGCDGDSAEVHHKSVSELDYLEVSTWMAVCRNCHSACETQLSAIERRKRGFLIDPVNKRFDEPHKI